MPLADVAVEMGGAFTGSQRLVTFLRSLRPSRDQIKTAIVTTLIYLAADARGWGIREVLEWLTGNDAPTEVRSFSDEARHQLAQEVVEAIRSGVGLSETLNVHEALPRDGVVAQLS